MDVNNYRAEACLARWLLITSALAFIMVGCGKKSATDQTLTSQIQTKLQADGATNASKLNVAVKDGVATLSGEVPAPPVELQALKIANSTPGVQSVNDQIRVNPSAANQGYPPLSAEPSVATAPPVAPASITIPAGERVSVRMIDSINSAHNVAGQVFRASLNTPLVSDGRVVVPAGTPVSVLLAYSKGAGRIKGRSALELRLSSLEYNGQSYSLQTGVYTTVGKARGKQTAVRTGIGAAAGAVIGALAGGGRGAAIGSAAGGGAGFGFNAFTHGQQVRIPSETVLTFRLRAPLTLEG
jgi:BON domain-containing protein